MAFEMSPVLNHPQFWIEMDNLSAHDLTCSYLKGNKLWPERVSSVSSHSIPDNMITFQPTARACLASPPLQLWQVMVLGSQI